MLILTDINDLGDKRLSPEEGVAELKERNAKLVEAKKIPHQALYENHAMAWGNPMAHNELIRRIQKLSSNIIIEDGGVPGAVAVRIPARDEDGQPTKKYITGFYKKPLPEWSSVVTDKNGLATREIRGWRPVVEALVRAGAITKEQYYAAFGEPQGQRSIIWKEKIQGR